MANITGNFRSFWFQLIYILYGQYYWSTSVHFGRRVGNVTLLCVLLFFFPFNELKLIIETLHFQILLVSMIQNFRIAHLI